ncbi:MAG: ABC transporter substrate-binding protein [Chloroflexi bacterium]|nr:ABC transporter substrate-binding protein [Chloroflexota bacterium]MDA8188554.1 ABC transporter substrate-binding protein [Dehalococcoidales bacterium]
MITLTRVPGTLVFILLLSVLMGCAQAGPPALPTPTHAGKQEPRETAAPKPTEVPKTQPTPTAKPAAQQKPAAEEKPAQPALAVKSGVLGVVGDGPVYIAIDRGYFKQEGLEVETVQFDSAARMIAPMAAGQLDVGAGAVGAGLFNAIARGIPIKIVADKAHIAPGHEYNALVARKDLVESGVLKDWKDLKGRNVAVSAKAVAPYLHLVRGLAKAGLSPSDVNVVEMGFPDINVAFANKSIDAAVHNEPFMTVAIEQGLVVRWKSIQDIYPYHQIGVVMYSPQFMKNAEAARGYMVAYLKGVRDFNEAYDKKKGLAEVVSIIAKHTGEKNLALIEKASVPAVNPDGYVNGAHIKADQEWYIKQGLVKTKADLDAAVDNQYVEYAVKRLGKSQP